MQLTPGLRGQVAAGPFLVAGQGVSRGVRGVSGLRPVQGVIPFARVGGSLDMYQDTSSYTTGLVTAAPTFTRRGEAVEGTWTQLSGLAGTPTDPTSATTRFQFWISTPGIYPQVWRYTGRNQFGEGGELDVFFTLQRASAPPPNLTLSASNAHQAGDSSGTINVTAGSTANASGGSGSGYTYSWPDISGFTKSPSGNICYYGVALGPSESRSGSGTVYVTDSNGATASASFNVLCENTAALPSFSVSVSPSSVSGGDPYQMGVSETDVATATATGAIGAVTWEWKLVSGVGAPSSPNAASTNFNFSTTINGPYSGVFRVTGTDSRNRTAHADVAASFYIYLSQGPWN
jgi:hypothetical protein